MIKKPKGISQSKKASSRRTLKKGKQQEDPSRSKTLTLAQLKDWVRRNPQDVAATLALADHWNRAYDGERVLDALRPLAELYPFEDRTLRGDYDRLLAFGYSNLNRIAEAEKVAQRGVAEFPEGIDFHYVLSFVKLSLREYDAAVEAGRSYLVLYEQGAHSTCSIPAFTLTSAHLSQLCNFMGVAQKEERNSADAISLFERAIAADPGNQMPYINLANLHMQEKDKVRAKDVIERGLASGRQIQELRIMAQALENRATVSACMMVRNEEELLGRCLASIRDWVDEIIVVDTGSNDRTVEIARSYGAKLYFHPWEGDFSKSRNYTLKYATCDWIFIIDADEEVYSEDIATIARVLNDPRHLYVSINVFNVYGKNEELTTFLPSVRFFRRSLNLRYDGIVHNTLQIPTGAPVLRADVRIKHYGYGLDPEKMKLKLARSKALLEKQLQENPDNFYALFNYAQLLRGEGEDVQATNAPIILKSAARAVELTDPRDTGQRYIHLMCLDQLGWTYLYLGEYDRALEFAERALTLKENYLDPLLLIGHARARKGEWSAAIDAYRKYLDVQGAYKATNENDSLILMHVNSRATACYSLGLIYEHSGNPAQAREFYRQTLASNRSHPEANLHLARHYVSEGNIVEAELCYRQHLEHSPESVEARMGLAYIEFQKKNSSEAIRHYEVVTIEHPRNGTALLKLGQIHAELGQAVKASEYFQRALDAGQSEPNIQIELAGIYQSLGRHREAIELYQHYMKDNPSTSAVLCDLGNGYFKLGDLQSAEDWYRKALKQMPIAPAVYRNLGVVLARAGKTREAVAELTRFVELEPDQSEVRELLGDLFAQEGDFQNAISSYEQRLRLEPGSVSALYSLAECYRNMGHRDAAIMGYRRAVQLDSEFRPAHERLQELAGVVGV